MNVITANLSYFAGSIPGLLFFFQTITQPDANSGDQLMKSLVSIATILLPYLIKALRVMYKMIKENRAAVAKEMVEIKVTVNSQASRITSLEQDKTSALQERDSALEQVQTNKAQHAVDLTIAAEEKGKLIQELESERKITTSLSAQNEDQEQRIQSLEQTIKGLTPMNEMVQMIFSGMAQAVTAGLTAYVATLPKLATSEQSTIPVPMPEKIGMN